MDIKRILYAAWLKALWWGNYRIVPVYSKERKFSNEREFFKWLLTERLGIIFDNLDIPRPPKPRLDAVLQSILMELYDQENIICKFPRRPRWFMSNEELRSRKHDLEKYHLWAVYPNHIAGKFLELRDKILKLLDKHLPKYYAEVGANDSHLWALVLDALHGPREFMRDLIPLSLNRQPAYYPEPLFHNMNHQLQAMKVMADQEFKKGKEPTDYPNKDRRTLVHMFFRDTSLEQLFKAPVSFSVPWKERHALIVAPTGQGKSQLIEALVWELLHRKDKPSIVIIDSKGGYKGLFERISKLDIFHPDTGEERDRLILIDPADEPALGVFASQDGRTNINELLRAWPETGEYTALQKRIMNHAVPVIVAMHGNFTDALDLLKNPAQQKFELPLRRVSPETRVFWEQEYSTQKFSQSLPGLEGKLDLIRSTPTLGKMFNARENNLDLFDATNSGKIVLVSTAFKHLDVGYSEVLTNYFLSLAFSAGVRRDTYRPETFIIVDEALPIINDITAKNFITLREYNIHCVYAVQSAKLIGSYWSAVGLNTDIKFSAGLKGEEIALMKPHMGKNATIDFLYEQRKGPGDDPTWLRYACFVEGVTLDDPLPLILPTGLIDRKGFMSDVAYEELRRLNKQRFARREEPEPPPEPPPETPPEPPDEPEPSDKPTKLRTPWKRNRK